MLFRTTLTIPNSSFVFGNTAGLEKKNGRLQKDDSQFFLLGRNNRPDLIGEYEITVEPFDEQGSPTIEIQRLNAVPSNITGWELQKLRRSLPVHACHLGILSLPSLTDYLHEGGLLVCSEAYCRYIHDWNACVREQPLLPTEFHGLLVSVTVETYFAVFHYLQSPKGSQPKEQILLTAFLEKRHQS